MAEPKLSPESRPIRIAAAGDVHFGIDSAGSLRPDLEHLGERADLLLLAGDLTRAGSVEEAAVLAEELRDLPVPVVAILGNHDYHQGQEEAVCNVLAGAGITVLDGQNAIFRVRGCQVGVAGSKGFGGGFAGACASEFGEPEMKAFVRHTRTLAQALEANLLDLDGVDFRIALLHYAPVAATLAGERLEIHPFLGSYLLGEAVDRGGADLVLHGHAHAGAEKGETPGGIPVRNVAQHVIGRAYALYNLDPPAVALRDFGGAGRERPAASRQTD